MSAATVQRVLTGPTVQKLEADLTKATDRVALLTVKAEEAQASFDGGDPGQVVAAEEAITRATREQAVLVKSLATARKVEAVAALKEDKRIAEVKRIRLVKRAGFLKREITDAMEHLATLLGENFSICDQLPGHEALVYWAPGYTSEASQRACKNVKPVVVRIGEKDLVTNPMTRQIEIPLVVPLVQVD